MNKKPELKRCQRPPFSTKSMTQQHFAEEANINNMVLRMQKGEFPDLQDRPALFMNAAAVPDFREMQEMVCDVTSNFNELPVEIRKEFNHDPAEFIEFLADQSPENIKKGRRLGIYGKENKVDPPRVGESPKSGSGSGSEKSGDAGGTPAGAEEKAGESAGQSGT